VTKLGYATNASVFQKRGDPWVSEREGLSNYGRNLMTEDPDFDRYFAKTSEKPDGESITTGSKPHRRRDDSHLRLAQARMRLKKALKESKGGKAIVVDGFAPGYFNASVKGNKDG
jgi:hypothetical protein